MNPEEKQKLFKQGIDCFNQEEFYDSHEFIEEIWLEDKSEDRLFLQGLILLAASFHHIQKGRAHEAKVALANANSKLQKYPNPHWGIEYKHCLSFKVGEFPKIQWSKS